MRLSVQPELQLWKPRCFWVLEGKNYASNLPLLMAVQQKSTQNWTKEEFCFKDLNQSEDKKSYFHPSSSSFPLLWTLESRTVFSICIFVLHQKLRTCIHVMHFLKYFMACMHPSSCELSLRSIFWCLRLICFQYILEQQRMFLHISGICLSICCLWTVLISSWWDDTLSWFGNAGLNWFVFCWCKINWCKKHSSFSLIH